MQETCACRLPPAGVNDIIKEHATLLKDATGFRVLIPDLYKGKIGVDKEEAHHVSSSCSHWWCNSHPKTGCTRP
jgi:hypothetical protein